MNDAGTLTWNANGTLATLGIADSLSGTTDSQTCNYFYDDFARLGGKNSNGYSVDCGTKWQQLFTFDPFGNIGKSGSGAFQATYSPSTNHFTLAGVTVSYDPSGNLLTDNLNTYTWDGYGLPNSINSTNLIHDAFGLLVEEQNGSTYTQVLYTPAGQTALMSGQTLIKAFVNLPGGGSAIYNSTGLAYYRDADWLGSSRLTSTPSQGVYSDSAYSPYGEQYALTGSADASFTGQNSDVTSTLYGFPYRENSPTQGRWVSPDPAGLAAVDPTNPQTWNRYAYVMNSPLANIDLLGLCAVQNYLNSTTTFGGQTWTTKTPIGPPTMLWPGPCAAPPPGCGWLSAGGSGEGSEWTGMECGNLNNISQGSTANNVDDWGNRILTPQQQQCVDDHIKAAAAIGTNALNNAQKAFMSGVPGVDWAGGFAINQLIKNLVAGGPIQWWSVVEAGGYGLLARAGWGTLKGASIAMYGMIQANNAADVSSCFSGGS